MATAQMRTAASEIRLRGSVIERGVGLPVAGAVVAATSRDEQPGGITSGSGRAAGTPSETDANGRFELTVPGPGRYWLRAQRSGYGAPGPELDAFEPAVEVTASAGTESVEDLRIEMARQGSITGRVVDRENRKPVAGFQVAAGARSMRVSFDTEIPTRTATTDTDGRFRMAALPPASYRIRIEPPPALRAVIQTGSVDLDSEEPTSVPCTLWWPGVEERDRASVHNLKSGQQTDLGDFVAEQCKGYSVAVRVSATACAPGSFMTAALVGVHSRQGIHAQIPCGKPFFLRRVVPGQYELVTYVRSRVASGRLLGTTTVTVQGNTSVELTMGPPMRVCGQIVMAEDAGRGINFEGLRVDIRGTPHLSNAEKETAVVDAEGNFCDGDVGPGPQRTWVRGLPEGVYVQATEYNASRAGRMWMPASGAIQHHLRLTLGRRPSRVEGEVTNGKRLQAGGRVFLIPWPAKLEEVRSEVRFTTTTEQGRYSFDGLPAGEYRMLAAEAELTALWTVQDLAVHLQTGKSLKLGSGEVKTVDLSATIR